MICSSKNWLKKQSLVFKISFSILICSFLGILFLLGIVTTRSETIISEQIMEHSSYIVQTSVNNINHLTAETEQALRNLRNILNQIESNDHDAIEIALKSTIKTIYNSGLDLSHITIYSFTSDNYAKGTLYSAFARDDQFLVKREWIKNFSEQFPWVKETVKQDQIKWSEPYDSPNSPEKNMVITCLLPFKFQGQKTFNGIVSISIDIKNIQNFVEETPFHDGGTLVLLSKKGLYITHPDPEINLKTTIYELSKELNNPQLYEIAQKVLSGKSGIAEMATSSIYNKRTIFFYAPIPGLDWGICLIFSQADLFKPIHDLQIIIIISATLGIFIFLYLINKICHYTTRPLKNLAKIAAQYGKGDFSEHIPEICSNDEIGTLSAAFYNMRKNLLNYIQKEKLAAIEQQKDLSELEIAQQIQRSVLPIKFPEHKTFDIYGLMIPSRLVGGDFYDFFFLNKHKIAIVMADVSGKGISAALYMMRAQEVIKHTTQYTKSIARVCNRVNNILCKGNNTCTFVTTFLAIINLKTGEMEYVNAGHLPPFLIKGSTCKKMTPKQNFVLGVRERIFYTAETIKLEPDTSIFLYTDGVTEAESRSQKFYGEERLQNLLSQKQNTAKDIIENVMTDIKQFTKGAQQSDDITMLAFHYKGLAPNVLTIPASMQQLHYVLNYIEKDMLQKEIDQSICAKMIVIAEELFANIALYAYEGEGSVTINTELQQNRYTITFMDRGTPYNPLEFKEPDTTQPLTERKAGGLGIFLARKMADSLEYEYKDGRNILKAEIIIRPKEK